MSSSAEPLRFSEVKFASPRPAFCLLGTFGRDFPLSLIAFAPFSSYFCVPERSASSHDFYS